VTNSGVATVSLTVTNVIRAPVANNDSYGVNKNSSLTLRCRVCWAMTWI